MSEWGRDDPRLAATAEEVPPEKALPPPPVAEIPALRGASSSSQQQPWTGPSSSVAHFGAAFAAHSPVKKTYSNPGGRDPQNAAIAAEQQLEPRGQSLPRNVAPPTRSGPRPLFIFISTGYLSEYVTIQRCNL
jgi:hypothetical protein